MIQTAAKRAFDLMVAGLGLLLSTALMVLIGIGVKLDSPGPMLYRQTRIGRGGRPFTLLKFRSLVRDADLLAANVSPAGDPRVTRMGRVLRTWYLDERISEIGAALRTGAIGDNLETRYSNHKTLAQGRVAELIRGDGPSAVLSTPGQVVP